MRLLGFLLAVSVSLAPTRAARAEDAPPVLLDAHAGSTVPIAFGALGSAELPHRILVQLEVGWMPPAYVDLINEVVIAFEGYSEFEAALIEAALESSLVLRPSVGWRPFPDEGLEVFAGYTLAVLGGGLAGTEAVEAATGQMLDRDAPREVPLSAEAHGVQVGVGWRFLLSRRLVLRATLSYFHVFASEARVDRSARTARGQEAVDAASHALDAYLEDLLTTYVHVPVVGLWLGYRF